MARGAIIHRVRIELAHVDRGVYESIQLTLARHPSETVERAVMRLLAFGLRHQDSLEFGRGVSATDEPDLWSRGGDGRVREWIEVGQPDAKRLVKACRQSERCTLFAFGSGARRWRTAQLEPIEAPDNLAVAWIEDAFVARVASAIDRQIRWSMTVSEGTVFLSSGDASFETVPEIWLGDPLA